MLPHFKREGAPCRETRVWRWGKEGARRTTTGEGQPRQADRLSVPTIFSQNFRESGKGQKLMALRPGIPCVAVLNNVFLKRHPYSKTVNSQKKVQLTFWCGILFLITEYQGSVRN